MKQRVFGVFGIALSSAGVTLGVLGAADLLRGSLGFLALPMSLFGLAFSVLSISPRR